MLPEKRVPSPDGKTLAVKMFRGNDAQVGVMPAEGGIEVSGAVWLIESGTARD